MKMICWMSCLFMCLASFLIADEIGFDLSCETISINNVLDSNKYRNFEDYDSGYHKTVMRIKKYPNVEEFVFKATRPIIAEGRNKIEDMISKESLLMNGRKIGEDIPIFIMSSRGFLPGEKIELLVATTDERIKSKTITVIPHPNVKESVNDEAKISAELARINPTKYRIFLEGFRKGEKLQFVSHSSGEELKQDLTYKNNTMFYYEPGVIGREGGVALIRIIRENGERMSLVMPWGMDFMRFFKGERKPVSSNFTTIKNRPKAF